MSYRSKVHARSDQKKFRRTAMSTKDINVKPKLMRGGIRL